MFSIRVILATCAMMIFIWFSLSVKCRIQLIYIRLFFIVMLFVGYRLLVTGVGVVNTLPALLLFYYCLYLVVEFLYGKVGFIQYFYGCIIAAVSFVARSRTSFSLCL